MGPRVRAADAAEGALTSGTTAGSKRWKSSPAAEAIAAMVVTAWSRTMGWLLRSSSMWRATRGSR
jgi:hypothetical protein